MEKSKSATRSRQKGGEYSMVEIIDTNTGEVRQADKMSDTELWDNLTKIRDARRKLSEHQSLIESSLMSRLQDSNATIKHVPGRGDIVLDKGTPAYNPEVVSQLYEILGEEVCDSGNRKLVSKKVTTTEKVDGVRVKQLEKHGESVKKIIEDSKSSVSQRPPRIKLVMKGDNYGNK